MKTIIFASLLAGLPLVSSQGHAQDNGDRKPTDADRKVIAACLDESWSNHRAPTGCIGKISDACLAANTEDGDEPVFECLERERVVWDELLNAKYKSVMEASQGDLKKQLKAVQQSWIKTRDMTCDWEHASWEGAPMGNTAYTRCTLYETAYRAVTLWGWAAFERR
ncbi:lysozyme inhibitor LprI family protein [Oryzibacter oryziterrae]|uniref:lysozyme inhibitor LprI family protein n=1 Tax=Oryzibacter oryziterrae TaxID=2766474 RepID=UPI001F21B651|nr:lysozyme inhibitor LprI family protein [Oryzibacter oryziterrae]